MRTATSNFNPPRFKRDWPRRRRRQFTALIVLFTDVNLDPYWSGSHTPVDVEVRPVSIVNRRNERELLAAKLTPHLISSANVMRYKSCQRMFRIFCCFCCQGRVGTDEVLITGNMNGEIVVTQLNLCFVLFFSYRN